MLMMMMTITTSVVQGMPEHLMLMMTMMMCVVQGLPNDDDVCGAGTA
jgi:hypothetical protein